jgi:hypothetical protein
MTRGQKRQDNKNKKMTKMTRRQKRRDDENHETTKATKMTRRRNSRNPFLIAFCHSLDHTTLPPMPCTPSHFPSLCNIYLELSSFLAFPSVFSLLTAAGWGHVVVVHHITLVVLRLMITLWPKGSREFSSNYRENGTNTQLHASLHLSSSVRMARSLEGKEETSFSWQKQWLTTTQVSEWRQRVHATKRFTEMWERWIPFDSAKSMW